MARDSERRSDQFCGQGYEPLAIGAQRSATGHGARRVHVQRAYLDHNDEE
jgi:hypothetical protein